MAEPLHVDDGFWAVLEPLLPERIPQRTGRPRVDDRIAFRAILFVLVAGAMTLERRPLLGCTELGSAGALLPFHRCTSDARLHRAPVDAWCSSAPGVPRAATGTLANSAKPQRDRPLF
jgi:hypothetical protein